MDQKDAMPSPIKSGQHDLVQELAVGFGIEVFGLVPVGKLSAHQRHRTEDLLSVALASRGDLRLRVQRGPGPMQGRTLSEGSLVLINDYTPFGLGFFFRLG